MTLENDFDESRDLTPSTVASLHCDDKSKPRDSPQHCLSPSREEYISELASPASPSGREDGEVPARTYAGLEGPRSHTRILPVTHEEIQLFNALID